MKKSLLNPVQVFLILPVLLIPACVNVDEIESLEILQSDAEYAVPLVNSTLTLESVLTDNFDDANIEYDENGVAVVMYSSDVVEKRSNEIFKPIVFPGPLPLTDTVVNLRFDQEADYQVERGIFRGDSLRFGFTSAFDKPVNVEVGIKQASLNGQPFVHNFVVEPGISTVSPLFSIRSYEFTSPENHLSFYYDARLPDGTRVELDNAYFEFTYLIFEYLEGYLGKNVQNLNAQNIKVNIFDLWQSGLLEFADPKIILRLDNSFGFPVQAIINSFEITNLNGEVIPLESSLFDELNIFDYPKLNEVGEVKSSEFIFNKDNSNFASAFNQKVTNVSYDVDALVNPDDNENVIGFYTFDSYYLMNVAVELPMTFKADNFELAGELEMADLPDEIDLVESLELKCYVTNLFPVDVAGQLFFLDDSGNRIDSLFEDGAEFFPAATVESDGSITPAPSGTDPFFIRYDGNRKEIFEQASQLQGRVEFSSQNNDSEWTSITKNQGLDVKIGLKFKLN